MHHKSDFSTTIIFVTAPLNTSSFNWQFFWKSLSYLFGLHNSNFPGNTGIYSIIRPPCWNRIAHVLILEAAVLSTADLCYANMAASGNSSEFPFNDDREFELKLGSSFHSKGGPKMAFHTIRCKVEFLAIFVVHTLCRWNWREGSCLFWKTLKAK